MSQRQQANEAQSPPARRRSVRPSALAQFFDKPQQRSVRHTSPAKPSSFTGPAGLGGTSKRTDLNDQRFLPTTDENGNFGGAFGRADFKNDVNLPRTEAQNILHRDTDDKADDEIYVVVPEHYTIAGVVPPTNTKLKVPKVENEYLMSPQLRRQLNTFELKQKEAVKLQRKAKADRDRMIDIMKSEYPDGVIGLEHVGTDRGNPVSNVYADRVQAVNQKHQRSTNIRQARTKNIVANSDSLQRRGYTFVHQTGNAPIQGAIATRKGAGLKPPQDTHSRLFAREESTFNPARAAALQKQDTRGRTYDLVSGIQRY